MYSQGCSIIVDIIILNIIKREGVHTVFFMSNIYTFKKKFLDLLDEILDSM